MSGALPPTVPSILVVASENCGTLDGEVIAEWGDVSPTPNRSTASSSGLLNAATIKSRCTRRVRAIGIEL
jgi:hypothetical protein